MKYILNIIILNIKWNNIEGVVLLAHLGWICFGTVCPLAITNSYGNLRKVRHSQECGQIKTYTEDRLMFIVLWRTVIKTAGVWDAYKASHKHTIQSIFNRLSYDHEITPSCSIAETKFKDQKHADDDTIKELKFLWMSITSTIFCLSIDLSFNALLLLLYLSSI